MREIKYSQDHYKFIQNIGNASHRPLLLLALQATKDSKLPVLELGMGEGSTKHLHNYCRNHKRELFSIDNDAKWVEKFRPLRNRDHHIDCAVWENSGIEEKEWSVVLVDHAPAERRHIDITALANRAQILVLHDSESRSPGYFYDRIWNLFQYHAHIRVEAPYSDASAVSNLIDLTDWHDTTFEGYPYRVTVSNEVSGEHSDV